MGLGPLGLGLGHGLFGRRRRRGLGLIIVTAAAAAAITAAAAAAAATAAWLLRHLLLTLVTIRAFWRHSHSALKFIGKEAIRPKELICRIMLRLQTVVEFQLEQLRIVRVAAIFQDVLSELLSLCFGQRHCVTRFLLLVKDVLDSLIVVLVLVKEVLIVVLVIIAKAIRVAFESRSQSCQRLELARLARTLTKALACACLDGVDASPAPLCQRSFPIGPILVRLSPAALQSC